MRELVSIAAVNSPGQTVISGAGTAVAEISARLNAEGIETRTVLVTDDIASAPLAEIGKRRGIAGDLTVFKIAGAAAEAGLSLDDVERLAVRTNYRTRSLGVAFGGCTLPGADHPPTLRSTSWPTRPPAFTPSCSTA